MTDQATGFTVQGKVLRPDQVLLKEGIKLDSAFKVDEGEVGLYRGDALVAKVEKGGFVAAAAALQEADQPFTVKGIKAPMTFLSQYRGHDVTHAFAVNVELARELFRSLCLELSQIEAHLASRSGSPAPASSIEADLKELEKAIALPDVVARSGKIRNLQRELAQRILDAASRIA